MSEEFLLHTIEKTNLHISDKVWNKTFDKKYFWNSEFGLNNTGVLEVSGQNYP